MIDVSFEINGRHVRADQVCNSLEKAILLQVADSVAKSLRSVRCSVHGEQPNVKCTGRRADDLSFEISGCCEELISSATKRLS